MENGLRSVECDLNYTGNASIFYGYTEVIKEATWYLLVVPLRCCSTGSNFLSVQNFLVKFRTVVEVDCSESFGVDTKIEILPKARRHVSNFFGFPHSSATLGRFQFTFVRVLKLIHSFLVFYVCYCPVNAPCFPYFFLLARSTLRWDFSSRNRVVAPSVLGWFLRNTSKEEPWYVGFHRLLKFGQVFRIKI